MCFPEYMCPFRLQKEVEMNMKKLLTTTFITAFFIISSAFFASAEETDLSEPVQPVSYTHLSANLDQSLFCQFI